MLRWQLTSNRSSLYLAMSCPFQFFYIFVLALGALEECSSKTLTWRLSTNFNSSKNWSEGREPCSTDTVVFPADVRLTVELPPGRHSMKELVLPSDGEIVIPQDSSILIMSKDLIDGSCDGTENLWLRTAAGRWLDPDNWKGANPAAPDLERIPCPTDKVIFPSRSTFRVELPPFSVAVATVFIDKQLLSGEEWEAYLTSPEGDRQFSGSFLEATGEDCTDPVGCECPAQWLSRWICANRECALPSCLVPVQPLGDCCMRCGAYMLYRFSSFTKLKDVHSAVKQHLGSEVSWHVGRTMGYIQVVISQDENTGDAEELARSLNTELLNDHKLGLIGKSVTASGPSYSKSALSPWFLFFLSMVFALAAFAVTFYYFESARGRWPIWLGGGPRFVTARFENTSGVVEIRERIRDPPRLADDVPRGFDNPMYSQEGEGLPVLEVPLPGGENQEDAGSLSDSTGSSTSYDRKTVTTLAIADDLTLEEVPIGQLIN